MKNRLLVAIVLAVSATAVQACPDRIPEGLTGVNIAKDVVTNGLATSITQVTGKDAAADILKRTEKTWKDAGFNVKRSSAVGWEIVSALGEKCLVTLQLTNRDGTFGYLSRSRPELSGGTTAKSMGAPIPVSAKVTSTVASDDDGRKGLTISMTSAVPPDDLGKYFMGELKEGKWSAVRSQVFKSPRNGETVSLMVSAQQGRKQIEIVIWPERETQVVMTVAESL